ncbi:MAG: hypothetical protein LBK28_04155, partial [Propionibacteriaceae bacterium]|nr:hypothetical protein [Propionibacteriaceae bacterium]
MNTSYYNYSITAWNQRHVLLVDLNDTPKEIEVTGWNATTIGPVAQSTAVVNAGSKADQTAVALLGVDYPAIFMDAGYRALRDEIAARADGALAAAKTTLVASLQDGLASIGVPVELDATDSWAAIAAKTAQALSAMAGDALNAALARLPWVSTPGTVSGAFYALLARYATYGGNYLANWLGEIDWLSLFGGKVKDTPARTQSLTVEFDRDAVVNTENPALTIVLRDANGAVVPDAGAAATGTYSYGDSCRFPTGEEPSRRTCT